MWMKLRKIVNFGPPTLFLWIVPIRVHCFFPASQTFKLHQPSIHQLKFSHSSSESDRQELCKTAPSFMLKAILVLQSRKKSKKIVGPFTANPLGPSETWGYRSARAPHKSRSSKCDRATGTPILCRLPVILPKETNFPVFIINIKNKYFWLY